MTGPAHHPFVEYLLLERILLIGDVTQLHATADDDRALVSLVVAAHVEIESKT
jgi:hypothetical protein